MVEGKEKKKEKKKNKYILKQMEKWKRREGKKMSGKNECHTIWRQRIIDTFVVQHTG